MAKEKAIYGLYKGNEFLDVGTVEELSEKYHVQAHTIRWWASPTHQKRTINKDGTMGDRMATVRLDKTTFEISEGGPENEKTAEYVTY